MSNQINASKISKYISSNGYTVEGFAVIQNNIPSQPNWDMFISSYITDAKLRLDLPSGTSSSVKTEIQNLITAFNPDTYNLPAFPVDPITKKAEYEYYSGPMLDSLFSGMLDGTYRIHLKNEISIISQMLAWGNLIALQNYLDLLKITPLDTSNGGTVYTLNDAEYTSFVAAFRYVYADSDLDWDNPTTGIPNPITNRTIPKAKQPQPTVSIEKLFMDDATEPQQVSEAPKKTKKNKKK